MSNERLRAAIHHAGLSVDQLALQVQVDTKTVRRWINGGRTPRQMYRLRVADALSTTEAELWPEEELRVDGRDEQAEILAAYAHADGHQAPDWRPLLARATRTIDLLDLTLTNILASPQAETLLLEKATAGASIRLLLAAPESAHLTIIDAELGENVSLLDIPPSAEDAASTLQNLETLLTAGAQARTHRTTPPNTILRFDDEMLLGLRLYGTRDDHAPLLHLKRHSDHGLFTQFTDHYDRLWQAAQPVNPAG